MKVLVVDDDPDQVLLLSMLLRQSGFEPIGADDSVTAAELATARKPECAVVDLRLPTEERGLWLIHELKRRDPAIHVIVLTGGDPKRLVRQTDATLIDEIIVKGAASGALIRKLKSVAAQRCL
jgi:DNA-binding NtrC family response regulator